MSQMLISAENFSANEILVRFSVKAESRGLSTGISSFDNLIENYKVKKITPILEKDGFYIYHISCKKEIDFSKFENLSKDNSEIIYTQPNGLNKMLSITPNDPEYYEQWGFEAIGADKSWEIEKGNEQIVIGLIDSGIDYNHFDLSNNIWINPNEIPDNGIDDDENGFIDDWQGWDFTDTEILDAIGDCRDRDNDPLDNHGHGTHCAGIISADTNNNLGVAGTTWFCKIMNIRAGFRTPEGGFLEDDDVASGIIYAADNGAKILSISWGDTDLTPIINDVIQYAYDMGLTIIASAGNEGGVGILYPAAFSEVISATAVNEDLELSTFSSYGEGLDLCAPGELILSTILNNEYKVQSGTSMASPFVAGAAALLLSQNPLLTNNEIYDALRYSCDDLGEAGYDNEYGYGIINTEKMFQFVAGENVPQAEITFPVYDDGISGDFQIEGVANCPNFLQYSVTFADEEDFANDDWRDVVTHNEAPTPYSQSSETISTLATFVSTSLPDATYYLRLSVKGVYGDEYVDIIKFHLDKSAPEFEAISITERYDFDKKVNFILAASNEPAQFDAICFSSQIDTFHILENKFSQIVSLKLPDNLPDDSISFSLKIVNKSGLTTTSEVYENVIKVDNSSIPTWGFEKLTDYDHHAFLCQNDIDFNNNGKKELVFMEKPEEGTYGYVRFCELNEDDLVVVDSLQKKCLPWSIGDSNGDGRYEILCNKLDSMLVYEAPDTNSFPVNFLDFIHNNTVKNYGSGIFYDINSDGNDEVIVRSGSTIDDTISYFDIYKRDGNEFQYLSRIMNSTSTISKNELSSHIHFGNFDGDDLLDVLISDIDGDIIISEAQSVNSFTFETKATLSIPVLNAYYSGIGNFVDDEKDEFIVGGYHEDVMNPDNQFWYFEVFRSSGDDQYESVDFIEISGVCSKNGICVANLNDDNFDEIIFAVSPDIYICSLKNDKFEIEPIWVGESYRSYSPVAIDLDNNGINELAFNQAIIDESKLVIYHYPEIGNQLSDAPQNFSAYPIDSNSVKLTWNPVSEAESYNIYRRLSDNPSSFLNSTTAISYTDSSVVADSFYYYQVSAVDTVEESYRTLEKLAVPTDPPIIDVIKMISLNSIRIDFTQSLNQTGVYLSNYRIDGIGFPESAIFRDEKSVLLTFDQIFEESSFSIEIRNIEGFYNTPMSDIDTTFQFEEDVKRPAIAASSLLSNKQVKITFTEYIDSTSALNLENYLLLFPDNFEGEITDILHDNDEIILSFSESFKPNSEAYFIKIFNLKDLAGNYILPGQNIIKILNPITNLKNVIVYPNPVRPENESIIHFDNLPTNGDVTLFIYNFAGEPVIKSKSLSETDNSCNLRNDSGKELASGIYFYLIKFNNEISKGKIAIIR